MFPVELGRFNCLVLVMGLLKIFQQNLQTYHRNESTSLCTIHFIYILVLEDVIGSDVGGRFLLAHPVYSAIKSEDSEALDGGTSQLSSHIGSVVK